MAWFDDFLDGSDTDEDKDRDIALNMLSAQLTAGINGHFQLSDMCIKNGNNSAMNIGRFIA